MTGAHGGNSRTARALDLVMWDFGGVFTGSPFHSNDGYAESLGTTPRELADLVLGYEEPDGQHPWHRLERGEATMAETGDAVAALARAAGIEGFGLRDFFKAMGGFDSSATRTAMLDVVASVRDAGVKNVIVTNNFREVGERWRSLVPEGLFDDIVDSCEVGVRKPDPAIYLLTLGRAGGVAPARAAFLDDHGANVDAARALGIRGIHVGENPLEAAAEVLELLGL